MPQILVKSLKINSLNNPPLQRNSVLLITLACLYVCNMLPAKVLFLDKHTAHLMKYLQRRDRAPQPHSFFVSIFFRFFFLVSPLLYLFLGFALFYMQLVLNISYAKVLLNCSGHHRACSASFHFHSSWGRGFGLPPFSTTILWLGMCLLEVILHFCFLAFNMSFGHLLFSSPT